MALAQPEARFPIASGSIYNPGPFQLEVPPTFSKMLENLVRFAWFLGSFFIGGPTVQLNNATITGVNINGDSKFLGIPYALPP